MTIPAGVLLDRAGQELPLAELAGLTTPKISPRATDSETSSRARTVVGPEP